MSKQLEIDSGHKSLVASWFGLENSKSDDIDRQAEETGDVGGASLPASIINSEGLLNQDIAETRAQLLAKADVTTYVGEKLKKKLHKSKRRRNDLTSEEAQTVKASKMTDKRNESDDDESRTLAVSKPKQQKLEVRPQLLTGDARRKHIQQKLSDPLTSKNSRKRLRKQLAKLEQISTSKPDETVAQPEDKIVPSSSHDGSQTKDCRSEPNSKNAVEPDVLPENKNVPTSSRLESRIKGCSELSNEQDIKADDLPEDTGTKASSKSKDKAPSEMSDIRVVRKRKRKKTRSKQKNIKKDNRPEHLKPGYKPSGTEV